MLTFLIINCLYLSVYSFPNNFNTTHITTTIPPTEYVCCNSVTTVCIFSTLFFFATISMIFLCINKDESSQRASRAPYIILN